MWIAIQNAVGARQGVGGGPGPTPPPYTPPLDAYPALAAYSVRKVSSSYSGPCIEIIRTSDSATQEIGFGSDGLVDSTAIAAFCSGTDGAISKWFDQSSNGNHALQPLGSVYIYTSGVVKTLNGKPALGPFVTNNPLSIPTLTFGGDLSFVSLQGYRNNQMAFGGASGTFFVYSTTGDLDNVRFRYPGANHDFTVVNQIEQAATLNVSRRSSSVWNLWNQGNLNSFTPTGSASFDLTYLLGGNGGGFPHSGPHQEIIFWNSDLGAAVLEGFNSSMNQYYQISNFPDYTSGFLADYSDAAAAYSVRKLSNTAIKCMRVRRTVPPFDEQDIGFTPAGDLDTAAISTFGGSDPLVVSRWYDQSGFSLHAVQNTPGSQPQIYNGTAVITKGGRPALEWDFSNDENFDIVGLTMTSKTVAIVFERLNNTSRALSSYAGSGSLGDEILIDRNGTNVRYFDGGLSVSATGATANRTLIYAYRNASSIGVAFDGGTYATASTPNSNANTNDISIGEDNGGGAAEPPGYHQEVILWSSDYSTTNRAAIETNINTYYSVYPTSGFLVDYPGSYRAYSLRKLQNLAQYAIRVQRHSGAFDEQDIGFTPSGDLDTQAIIDFAGTDVVGVKTWYNQVHVSSAQNLTQSNTASQPLIFDGTSVYQSNGKPAIYYDATDKQLADLISSGTGVNTDFFNVHQRNSGTGYFNHWEGSGGFQVARMTTQYVLGWSGGTTGPAVDTDQHVFTGIATGTTGQIRLDGTASTPGTLDANRRFNGKFAIQGRPGFPAENSGPGDIYHQEFIQYDFNNTGADVTAIENDIKAYYSIP